MTTPPCESTRSRRVLLSTVLSTVYVLPRRDAGVLGLLARGPGSRGTFFWWGRVEEARREALTPRRPRRSEPRSARPLPHPRSKTARLPLGGPFGPLRDFAPMRGKCPSAVLCFYLRGEFLSGIAGRIAATIETAKPRMHPATVFRAWIMDDPLDRQAGGSSRRRLTVCPARGEARREITADPARTRRNGPWHVGC